jgi:hypothetical protein
LAGSWCTTGAGGQRAGLTESVRNKCLRKGGKWRRKRIANKEEGWDTVKRKKERERDGESGVCVYEHDRRAGMEHGEATQKQSGVLWVHCCPRGASTFPAPHLVEELHQQSQATEPRVVRPAQQVMELCDVVDKGEEGAVQPSTTLHTATHESIVLLAQESKS